MEVDDITIETFIENIKNGVLLFKGIAIEDYSFTLENTILDEVIFQGCFVNINFKNCSMKNTKFIECNLKCISFENCDLSESIITECAIESLEMNNCNLNGINFGTNYAYGYSVTPNKCFELFKEGNTI